MVERELEQFERALTDVMGLLREYKKIGSPQDIRDVIDWGRKVRAYFDSRQSAFCSCICCQKWSRIL